MTKEPICCCDGCKAEVADMSDAQAKGWHFLEISKRYRCPACARALERVNAQYTESDHGDNVQGF